MRCFQGMLAHGDGQTVYDARRGVDSNSRVGTWIRGYAQWEDYCAVLRQDSASWLDISFLRCTAERRYLVSVTHVVAQYEEIS